MPKSFADHDLGLVPKVVPRGKALKRNAEELDAMTSAATLAGKVDDAVAEWKAVAPGPFKRILESEVEKS